ncbi:MAG: cell division protein FtsZ [Succinivibrionaceae bacterium]
MSDIYQVSEGSGQMIPENNGKAIIKVIGVGGGGSNSVQHMVEENVEHVDFIAINTDLQALNSNLASEKIQIGVNTTRGLGSGSNPEVGKTAAEESKEDIKNRIKSADIVFITAGMGGGTGTGASPVVAEIAKKELGALTVAIVTKPYTFEGKQQMIKAEAGIEKLKEQVDALIVIPNDKLLKNLPKNITILGAFQECNRVLKNAVKGISDVIKANGYMNLDFNDIKAALTRSGSALIGMGHGEGENAIQDAFDKAVNCPLVDDMAYKKAKNMVVNVSVNPQYGLLQVSETVQLLQDKYGSDTSFFKIGIVFDGGLKEDQANVTVLLSGLTDIDNKQSKQQNKVDVLGDNSSNDSYSTGSFFGNSKPVDDDSKNEPSLKKSSPFESDHFELPSFLTKKAD